MCRTFPWTVKTPLHRTVTFIPPLSNQNNGQDAEWSPNPRESCSCVTAPATFVPPLKDPLSTYRFGGTKVSQKRQKEGKKIIMVAQRLPWSPNGGTVVATVIVQYKLLVTQKRHSRGGRKEAKASPILRDHFCQRTYLLCAGDHGIYGHAWASYLPPLSILGSHSASFEPLMVNLTVLWSN